MSHFLFTKVILLFGRETNIQNFKLGPGVMVAKQPTESDSYIIK